MITQIVLLSTRGLHYSRTGCRLNFNHRVLDKFENKHTYIPERPEQLNPPTGKCLL